MTDKRGHPEIGCESGNQVGATLHYNCQWVSVSLCLYPRRVSGRIVTGDGSDQVFVFVVDVQRCSDDGTITNAAGKRAYDDRIRTGVVAGLAGGLGGAVRLTSA